MKKALSFAVALGLVAGMASSAAAADVDFHGDARWRGVTINDTNGDEASIDGKDKMDQRYRMITNVNITDDLMVGIRVNLRDGMFEGANANTTSKSTVDRAYMKIKMLGGTYLIGRQNASWGNKFLGWGNGVDRIKGVYKNGNLTYGGYLQQNAEAGDNNDSETYGAFFVGKAGDTKWGVLPNYIVNHSAAAAAAGTDTGFLLDVFFNTKAGAANIMTEFVYKGGDMLENADGDAAFGGMVGASMGMDALTLKGLVAFYKGNAGDVGGSRDCDNDFAPTLLVGTCQETAIMEFGGKTNSAATLADDMAYIVVAGADMKVDDKMSVGAAVAMHHMSDSKGVAGGDLDMIELNLSGSYVLAKGVTYKIGVAYGMWDNASVSDDETIAVGNSISVKF